MVAFRRSGSRVVSRITIERFRLSSQATTSSATPAATGIPGGAEALRPSASLVLPLLNLESMRGRLEVSCFTWKERRGVSVAWEVAPD